MNNIIKSDIPMMRSAPVNLSQRYIQDRFLPDKAIDLLDEAGSRVNLATPEHAETCDRKRLKKSPKRNEKRFNKKIMNWQPN